MHNKTSCLIVAVICITLCLSCNLFSPRELDEDKWYMVGEAWVIEGKKKMWEKDWEGAAKDFAKAIEENGRLSEAYFYLGKCILRLNHVDLNQVWDEIKPSESDKVPFLYTPPTGKKIKDLLPTPFPITLYRIDLFDTLISNNSQDTVLDFNIDVIEEPYVADTLIDSVFLERKRIYDAVYQSIGWLEKIHINPDKMDKTIKREQYESDYLIEISVKSVLGIMDLDHNGILDWEFSKKERNVFRIISQDIPSLDSMDFDSLKAISKDPHDIKENLDLILYSLLQADSSFKNFKKDLVEGAQQSDALDTSMADDLGKMISNFNKILPFFYYDDFRDNDGDAYNTNGNYQVNGKISWDRMIWIDWDFDEKIDVYSPADTAAYGHLHIGDPIHKAANPTLYTWVDPTDEDFYRYKYSGPYNYEFIGGDWGVEEEILDGEDNDGDSIIDEDSRISADTLDDDGDWYNTNTSTNVNNAIGLKSYNPMIFASADNFVVAITATPAQWDSVIVDSLYSALHNSPVDTLYKFYPQYNFSGSNNNFPFPVHLGVYKGDTTNQTEFIGGDYGMDEEWYDGLDNDGDGLFDEDAGEYIVPVSMRDNLITELRKLGLRGNQ